MCDKQVSSIHIRTEIYFAHGPQTINIKKCKHIKFTRNRNIVKSEYRLCGEILEEVQDIRDLGIRIDSKLKFDQHIETCIAKASKMLGFVLRECKNFKKPLTKMVMYNSLVRSNLEYCSVVWSPIYKVHVQRIEKLQKRFLWHLSYSCNLGKKLSSYEDRLNHFNMFTLEIRRKVMDLIFLKRIVSGSIDCPDLLSKMDFYLPRHVPRPGNNKLFHIPRSRTNLKLHSFLSRAMSFYREYQSKVDLSHDTIRSIRRVILSKI